MRPIVLLAALATAPRLLAAQQTADSIHQHGDTLSRRAVQLDEITVTAAPANREDPTNTTRVSGMTLRRVPAINPYELLRETAGAEVHDQGQGPGFASDVSVRGFSSDHGTDLALWIDGVPINEPVNGHAEGYSDWSLLFPQVVREIDLYHGPTSPLYGNFALAGVVNIRTIERIQGASAQLSGGMYGRADGALLTGFDHGRTGGVFGVRGMREAGWRPGGDSRLGQVHGRIVHDLSPSTSLDAGVELYAAGWHSSGFLSLADFDAAKYDQVSDPTDGGFKRRAQERVSLRVLTSSSVIWRSTAYATQGRWQLFLTTPPEGGVTEGSGSQTEEEDRRYGFGATSALTYAAPNAEITIGTEGRWDHARYENYGTVSRGRADTRAQLYARQLSGALFVQASADVGPHLRIIAGGRYDYSDTRATPIGSTGTAAGHGVASPKLGALYHLRRVGDLYANLSRGFRQTDGVIFDPTLAFITAWAYETGLKVDAGPVNATAALFRMDVSNEQTFDPITAQSTSGGASRRQGLEVSLRALVTPALAATVDWSFNDAKYRRLVTEAGDTLSGARVFNTARHVGSAALELAPAAAFWHLRAGVNVVGPYTPFAAPGVELASYGLVNLSGGVRLGAAELQLGARNLLDHRYPELRAGDFVVPGQPRSVYGSVRYIF